MVVYVTRYEADGLNICSRKTKFLGCWILETICTYTNEELYSSLAVVRCVVLGEVKHKKFKATPSFVRRTVLVKLTQEDDVACLHKQVYEWQVRESWIRGSSDSRTMYLCRTVGL